MNITYCWSEPSGYLTACIAELSRRADVNVTLLTWETAGVAPFDLRMPASVKTHTLSKAEREDYAAVRERVLASRPDVVFLSGWAHKPYVRLASEPRLAAAKFVMGADTQLRFDLRQKLAPLRIGRFLKRMDAIFVPGERGFQLMRYWGVPESKLGRLLYCIDYQGFSARANVRFAQSQEWPRRFLYVGRYVDVKGINTLVAAYRAYRQRVRDPWPLTTCGAGPLKHALAGTEGVDDRGFMQPGQLAEVFQEAGVFVLASRHEPWGQVIVEAAASGLPVVCTQACGAGVEAVREFHNGMVVPIDDAPALCRALLWMHENYERLPVMGRESQHLASAYSAERWADNQLAVAHRLTAVPGGA